MGCKFHHELVSMRDSTDSSTETLHYNAANVHPPHGGDFKQASKKCRYSLFSDMGMLQLKRSKFGNIVCPKIEVS